MRLQKTHRPSLPSSLPSLSLSHSHFTLTLSLSPSLSLSLSLSVSLCLSLSHRSYVCSKSSVAIPPVRNSALGSLRSSVCLLPSVVVNAFLKLSLMPPQWGTVDMNAAASPKSHDQHCNHANNPASQVIGLPQTSPRHRDGLLKRGRRTKAQTKPENPTPDVLMPFAPQPLTMMPVFLSQKSLNSDANNV